MSALNFPVDADGNLNIKRRGLSTQGDWYHILMKMSWKRFIFVFVVCYFITNSFFAFLYYIGGDAIANSETGSYWDAFVFSFQTSSTIGYGHLLPATNYAKLIMMLDTLSGLLFVAITTGLAFGKFSRPTARVLFSDKILINNMNGQKTLMFRMVNARSNQMVDARVKAVVSMTEKSLEGLSMRRIYDLKLVRSTSPLFSLSWTVMHTIDEKSPLYGLSIEQIKSADVLFIASITGVDDVFSQMVYDRHIYYGAEVVSDRHFEDVMRIDETGAPYIDYGRFHDLI